MTSTMISTLASSSPLLRVLNARWWLPLFTVSVLVLALWVLQSTQQDDVGREQVELETQRHQLASEVRQLQRAPALPPVHIAWQSLSDYLSRFDLTLKAAMDDQHDALWPQTSTPYWRGSVVGDTPNVTDAVLSLKAAWNRYQPVALHMRGSSATVLIAVYGTTGEVSP